jgi:hypothetical protein
VLKHQCFQFITRLSASSSSTWLRDPCGNVSQGLVDNLNPPVNTIRPFDRGPVVHNVRATQDATITSCQPCVCCTTQQQPGQVSPPPAQLHPLPSPPRRICCEAHSPAVNAAAGPCFGASSPVIDGNVASCRWVVGAGPFQENNATHQNAVHCVHPCPYGHVVVSPGTLPSGCLTLIVGTQEWGFSCEVQRRPPADILLNKSLPPKTTLRTPCS